MDKKLACYCGLYCGNCAVKVKVEPAAKDLYDKMKSAGFEDVISFIPGGEGFWPFLKGMAEDGLCVSCRDGNGGNPGCAVRICARDKTIARDKTSRMRKALKCAPFVKTTLATNSALFSTPALVTPCWSMITHCCAIKDGKHGRRFRTRAVRRDIHTRKGKTLPVKIEPR